MCQAEVFLDGKVASWAAQNKSPAITDGARCLIPSFDREDLRPAENGSLSDKASLDPKTHIDPKRLRRLCRRSHDAMGVPMQAHRKSEKDKGCGGWLFALIPSQAN
jgi:hypothetical protein